MSYKKFLCLNGLVLTAFSMYSLLSQEEGELGFFAFFSVVGLWMIWFAMRAGKKRVYYIDFSKGRATMSPALTWVSILVIGTLFIWISESTMNLMDEIVDLGYLRLVNYGGYVIFYLGAIIILLAGIGIFRIRLNDVPVGKGARVQEAWNIHTGKAEPLTYSRDYSERSLDSFDEEVWDLLKQNEPHDFKSYQRALTDWKIIRIFSIAVGGFVFWLAVVALGLVNLY